MKAIPKPKKKVSDLIAVAKKNSVVTKKVAKEEPVILKEGTPLDHSVKHEPTHSDRPVSAQRVGCSVGVTLNMENYESMRIDTWLSDEVKDGETEKQALKRVYDIAKECVAEFSADFQGA